MHFCARLGLPIVSTLKPTKCLRSSRLNFFVATRGYSNNLQTRIKLCGPISVAEYMKEALINPRAGYYMHRDVFGSAGDFITSPEISQLFGEMIAVWILNEWTKIGSPQPLQLIELGPGRGTMMRDMLRVFGKLGVMKNVEICMVEVSEELSSLQASNLCVEHSKWTPTDADRCYQRGITPDGVSILWFKSIFEVPRKFSILVAHEFFDALPIHKFQKTPQGWREVLVDIDPKNEGTLRFILSQVPTPSSLLLVKKTEKREHIEVSPQSGVLMEHIASRLESQGGFALVADYGHFGDKEDTFRAFRRHKLHDPLVEPGSADLTADVDFAYLKDAAGDKLVSFGPISQRDFLTQLHIDVRLKNLLASASKEESQNLLSGYRMIMDENGMGKAFKFMCFFPAVLQEFLKIRPPYGFQN